MARAKSVNDVDRSIAEIADVARQAASVTPIRREPTATIELLEDELRALLEGDDLHGGVPVPECDCSPFCRATVKLTQALDIESGPGGSFWTGGEAA